MSKISTPCHCVNIEFCQVFYLSWQHYRYFANTLHWQRTSKIINELVHQTCERALTYHIAIPKITKVWDCKILYFTATLAVTWRLTFFEINYSRVYLYLYRTLRWRDYEGINWKFITSTSYRIHFEFKIIFLSKLTKNDQILDDCERQICRQPAAQFWK